MLQYINLSSDEQYELLTRASASTKISPLLIEKDFWVTFLLNNIFLSPLSHDLTFKGGTSLSKCFDIISRFSEDIDLTIDSSIFNNLTSKPSLSKNDIKRLLEKNNKLANEYVFEKFIPILSHEIRKHLDCSLWNFKQDEHEPKNIRFFYPSVIALSSNYIKNSILIELGVRGKSSPFTTCQISSIVEEQSASILRKQRTANIKTLSVIRTFWEKITLLHAENNRPTKISGDRLSRHYYDVYQMIQKGISKNAIDNIDLLKDVIENKKSNFRCSWAAYEKAIPGSLNIVPNNTLLDYLENDYKNMELMIFFHKPHFKEIVNALALFQNEFNQLKSPF